MSKFIKKLPPEKSLSILKDSDPLPGRQPSKAFIAALEAISEDPDIIKKPGH